MGPYRGAAGSTGRAQLSDPRPVPQLVLWGYLQKGREITALLKSQHTPKGLSGDQE